MSQKEIIQGMKEIAQAVLPAGAEVLLFGSRARGDARADSDWDILILINGERATGADFDKYAYPFVDYGWSIGEHINPLIYSFSDWNRRSITPFYKNVQAEGISLCHWLMKNEDGTLLARLQNMRHTGDYDDFIDWTQADVEPYISKVEEYVKKIKSIIKGLWLKFGSWVDDNDIGSINMQRS